MELDYLPSDKVYKDDARNEGDNRHRWLYYWQHSGVMDQVWRFNVDYTKVSDPYFNDFSSKYGSSTDGYATQKFSVGYAVQNFDAVSTKKFQVFDQSTYLWC
jgi:LPS-assembly protein